MKNKKGFTLVELLTVVIIIALVSILVLPRILEKFESKKIEISKQAEQILFVAASQYIEFNSSEMRNCITIGELADAGFLVRPVLDITNNTVIPDNHSIKITYENNQHKYEYSEIGCGYNITYKLNGVGLKQEVTSIYSGETKNIEFELLADYEFPASVTVTGANHNWNSTTGVLTLSNATNDVVVAVQAIDLISDTDSPTLTINLDQPICSYETSVTIVAKDVGESGLSDENIYQYYLSTSSTQLLGGQWTNYTSNSEFIFSTDKDKYTPGTYYLWVYPIKDNRENVSDNRQFGTPYNAKTINLGYEICYAYTGSYQKFTVPHDGTYKFNAWGSQGASSHGGNGGYTAGNISLTKNDNFYVYVGGTNGYNGGGAGCEASRTGGGATDIRWFSSTPSSSNLVWNSTVGLNSRIMIAGGGGGNRYSTSIINGIGHAGGLTGSTGIPDDGYTSYTSTGGSQTSGGVVKNHPDAETDGTNGSYGKGGNGGCDNGTYGGSYGGGGGLYGGAGGSGLIKGNWPGGGGSSYISGHYGSIAVTSASNSSPKCSSATSINCSYHYSNKIFTNTIMTAGNQTMPAITTGTETGHTGNGYVKITYISE